MNNSRSILKSADNGKAFKVTEHNNWIRGVFMNPKLTICLFICLTIIAAGQAAGQPTYGTKVQAGEADIGLPLSGFTLLFSTPNQVNSWISYWDINANGMFDEQDVPYLQLCSANVAGQRCVRANDIRLAGWGGYAAGSYVKPIDLDIGKPLIVSPPALTSSTAAPASVSYYYMDVTGSIGYDLGDPVYLKVLSPTNALAGVGTNDIRITANGAFPAGSKVSLNDPDAGKPLALFKLITGQPTGGPTVSSIQMPVAQFSFFNANGNTIGAFPIYDDGDVVYFDVTPINIVSPNDIRLY